MAAYPQPSHVPSDDEIADLEAQMDAVQKQASDPVEDESVSEDESPAEGVEDASPGENQTDDDAAPEAEDASPHPEERVSTPDNVEEDTSDGSPDTVRLEAELKRFKGIASGTQRKLGETEQRLRALEQEKTLLQAKLDAFESMRSQMGQPQGNAQSDDIDENSELYSDYPEMKAIVEANRRLERELAELKQTQTQSVEQQRKAEYDKAVNAFWDVMDAEDPGWNVEVDTPEFKEFLRTHHGGVWESGWNEATRDLNPQRAKAVYQEFQRVTSPEPAPAGKPAPQGAASVAKSKPAPPVSNKKQSYSLQDVYAGIQKLESRNPGKRPNEWPKADREAFEQWEKRLAMAT